MTPTPRPAALAAALVAGLAAPPALAEVPPLGHEPAITEGLIATAIAYEIGDKCAGVDARILRGIAARQFQRAFLLAEGMDVLGADLSNGLLSIDLARPEPERIVRKITIAGDKA